MTSALRNAFEYELFQKLSSSTNKKLILDFQYMIIIKQVLLIEMDGN